MHVSVHVLFMHVRLALDDDSGDSRAKLGISIGATPKHVFKKDVFSAQPLAVCLFCGGHTANLKTNPARS